MGYKNTSKDQIPAQDNVLLGAVVDTRDMQFRISNKKMEEIKDLILWWWVGNIEEVSGFTMKSSPTVSSLHFNHVLHGDSSRTGMF